MAETKQVSAALLSGWAGASTAEAGRTQLTKEFKAELKKFLADATGEDEAAFDFRSLNSSAQTTRASSESMGARSNIGREKKTWVFLGRVSESDKHIADTLKARLGKVCSVAVLFSKSKKWAPYAVLYHPDHKALCDKICAALGFNPSKAEMFTDVAPSPDPEASESKAFESEEDIFLDETQLNDILRNLRRKKSIILTGPPGCGKTFVAERLATKIISGTPNASLTKIQFHPSYSYEDFVRGWRPTKTSFEVTDGVLVKIANEAADRPESYHVLVIDEINRANVTKVFGELLSLVEVTKRGPKHALTLACRKEGDGEDDGSSFYLPDNVYIIGTMNTADRSIAMVDFALRRRFSFFYIKPAFDSIKFQALLISSGAPAGFVKKFAEAMAELNAAIVESSELGHGYEIGHSYFVPRQKISDVREWYGDILDTELAPLFLEYWFEDEAVAEQWTERLRSLAGLIELKGSETQESKDSGDLTGA